jgi:hypothetical protein
MVMECRLLGLANSLVRFQGWPVVGIGAAEEFPAAISGARVSSGCCVLVAGEGRQRLPLESPDASD